MIVTCCDARYLPDASTLIKSCARHEPDQSFYLFLVNGDQSEIEKLHKWHPRLVVEGVAWEYDPVRWRGLMCSARSIPIQKVLEEYREPTLYLDSDILIRGSLREIWQALETSDLMVKHRPQLSHLGVAGTRYASTFNSGVVAIAKSAAGSKFAQEYNRLLRAFVDSGKPIVCHRPEHGIDVYADQELLYVSYHNLREALKFLPLPDKFNDAAFHPESVIWHGKGTAREHPLYVVEKYRYRYDSLFCLLSPLSRILTIYRSRKKTK